MAKFFCIHLCLFPQSDASGRFVEIFKADKATERVAGGIVNNNNNYFTTNQFPNGGLPGSMQGSVAFGEAGSETQNPRESKHYFRGAGSRAGLADGQFNFIAPHT